MSEKASKGRFPKPEKLHDGKGKEKRKEREEEKKSNGCTLSSYNGYLGEKKLLDANGPFGGNVIKNPARYAQTEKIDHPPRSTPPTLYEQILA